MRFFDFSSWQGAFTTILGLAIFALIGVGIRVLMMLTIQQRQQRMNRQINERLKTLISAYRALGGSFTGELTVSPAHLRPLRDQAGEAAAEQAPSPGPANWERPRLIRDAVEMALSDILLLGTEEHVRLAGQAARDMAAGRPIYTAELVISLRNYIRKALDLEPISDAVQIPHQGPTRPQAGSRRSGRGEGARDRADAGGGGGGGMGSGVGAGRGEDEAGSSRQSVAQPRIGRAKDAAGLPIHDFPTRDADERDDPGMKQRHKPFARAWSFLPVNHPADFAATRTTRSPCAHGETAARQA